MTKKQRPRTIARDIVRKMEIDNGDVILLKRGSLPESVRMFNALRNALGATGREQCIVVVVNEFDEISTISKKEMLSYGWEWIGVPEDEEE